ncbi:hypothetical protein PEX1_079110 [Penicillium expansum]|uniref:Integral membrane protein n=1 Tax=Penicillium expansum TaxID=27334 RepID=A0A0A2J9I8_PENEN|nr:hypothetical protein PEX2_021510 [Penicillium expansum]KGO49010.1 hypothetical protein PEXP_010590 [Penicillium expansum]KGO57708.1 hypothetical protein PEX2_021510 [Penicillium expansum]KGO63708.1 hypothetical protein PEX1_079110 [Penicillium expansum]
MKVSGSMEPALRRHHGRDNVRVFKPLLRAYALGYLSSVTPKLVSYVRQLRNKDWTTQQKLQEGKDPGQAITNPLEHHRPELAGRTMDLTIYMVTRAVDAVACAAWGRWSRRRRAQNRWTTVESLIPGFADATVFAMSAAVVMWAWFYLPERLPRTYEKWIGEAAQVDSRLIEALRRVRRGVFVYGKDTGQAPLLQSMCKDYNWPEVWGDPAKVAPIPCEMVHMGCGPSCEKHALYRFAKTFKFACATYIPLQIVFRLRRMKSATALRRALFDAAQSSAFLASFVSLFYYSVCLARTRLGPKIFDAKTVTPMMWDSGLCVGAGCLMCGWSILVEKTRKRQELALFVAPRAAATVLPRLYDKKVCIGPSHPLSTKGLHPHPLHPLLSASKLSCGRFQNNHEMLTRVDVSQYQSRERVAFAVSAAILITCLRERPSTVRGVFGRITSNVLN